VHCETAGNKSTEHIDIIGDWKWQEGRYEVGVGLYHEICGRLDGVLPVRPPEQENGERVIHESYHSPHFYYWYSEGHGAPQTCNWKHPGVTNGN
jgi:hypothetical protein